MTACLDCGGSECICRASERIRCLSEACQLFTQALGGPDGYLPTLGAPKTKRALELMYEADVAPVFYHERTAKDSE